MKILFRGPQQINSVDLSCGSRGASIGLLFATAGQRWAFGHVCASHLVLSRVKLAKYKTGILTIHEQMIIIVFVSVSHCKTMEYALTDIFGLFVRHANVYDISRIVKFTPGRQIA